MKHIIRFLNLILLFIIMINCSDKYYIERKEFTNNIIRNPEKFSIIFDTSIFNCKNKKDIISKEMLDKIKCNKFIFYKDDISFIQKSDPNERYYFLIGIDTVHYLVYKNELLKYDFITISFQLVNGKWCIDTVLDFNVIDWKYDGDF